MTINRAIAGIVWAAAMAGASAQERLPTISAGEYSTEQKQAAAEFEAARKTPIFGPFEPLLYSPQLMSQARAMGDYLRFHASIGTALSELAILITAREWTQDYEWYVHYPLALKAGIRTALVEAIADGRRPDGLREEEDMVYAFVTELHHLHRVSDTTFARVEKRFGKQGVVDLTGICGYYSLLAMELNVAQYEIPKDAKKLVRFPR